MGRIYKKDLYKKELYKKYLHDPDNYDGVITYLELGILECVVKWALGSITMSKASGGDGITVELFQILKDDAVKVLHSMSANLENSAVATGPEKVSFHSNPKERQRQRMLKLPHSCTHLTLQFSSFSSVTQSHPTLQPHESQHARPLCPSPTPGVHSNSCSSSR